MRDGIDHTAFWNVWRLTPSVYRYEKSDPWRVKHDPRLTDDEGIKERSALVLSTIISILLARQATKRATRYIPTMRYSEAKAKSGTKMFKKADKNSEIIGTFPDGEEAHFYRLCDAGTK